MNQYFNPATGEWTDHCPWPRGKMPQGAAIRVDTMLMDGMQRDIAAAPAARVLTDAERRAERTKAVEDHFNEQRESEQRAIANNPRAKAYYDMCARMQRGAA